MKGIIKFCIGLKVMEQRFYHSREHRELIMQGYKGEYDNVVFVPKMEETWDEIMPVPEVRQPIAAHESMILWDKLFTKKHKSTIAIA